jgi:hypothetical protein
MPIDIHSNELRRYIVAMPSLLLAKLIPRKRGIAFGIPSAATVATMVARETTVDEMPITSGVAILDITSQKA